jgi:two-component system, OmpR family, sensor kinase
VSSPSSLRARVICVVLGLLAVILAGLFTVVDVILSARLHDDARTRLTDRVGIARQLDDRLDAAQLVDRLRGDGVTVRICQAGGANCVAAASEPPPPGAGPRPHGPRPGPAKTAADTPVSQTGPVLFVRTDLRGGQVLTLSLDTTQIADAVHRLILLETVGGITALALAGLAASWLSHRALRPLDEVTALARQIAAGDRGQRLSPRRTDTELGRTAAAFDDMLDELETALARANAAEERMRGFLSDASHELRTPVAGLQANAELILREDLERPRREAVAVAMVRETRRAARLVDDLLSMARLGHDGRIDRQPVNLCRLARTEISRAQVLAPALTFTVTGPAELIVPGDPLRLGQVLTNLLDNARHATPAGGTVTLTISEADDRATVTVHDSGPGVPDAEREIIFERFARGSASRSAHTGGTGLGLTIARGWARAHGGDLTLTTDTPGASFRLELPSSPLP